MTMQMDLHPQYITNEDGEKVSVILPIEEFENIQNIFKIQDNKDIDLKELQIESMAEKWNNKKDEAWNEL